MEKNIKIYNAAIYVRLSKDDGDKVESDSIANQKDLIRDYLKNKPDIHIYCERIDDGYSGVNFERPAFLQMLEEIKAGKINCIVVKDLSRFGRNYIESGRYIEKIFPFMDVRFIAINDNYDSAGEKNQSDHITIPFKNLVNDAYCRDISIKIRSQLEIKRKKGDFIGSFPVYGYLKSKENRNRLVIDEYASRIVRDIFDWKLEGMSSVGIADKLNILGILSPMEYKKSIGLNYESNFKISNQAKWSPVAVNRILKNEIYTGVLEQGKGSTPNYKIKERTTKSKKQWIRVENAHEPIVSEEKFRLVNQLLLSDTRISPDEETVYLFAGITVCSDCGQNMIRKTVPSNKKKYIYYVCSTNKEKKGCSSHSIREDLLAEAIFQTIKVRIENILAIEHILEFIHTLPLKQDQVQKVDILILQKKEEIERYKNIKVSLYENLSDGIVDKKEYQELKSVYNKKCEEAEKAIARLQDERNNFINDKDGKSIWIDNFKKYKDIKQLDRKVVVNLIDKVIVYEGLKLEIQLAYENEYNTSVNFIKTVSRMLPTEIQNEIRKVV